MSLDNDAPVEGAGRPAAAAAGFALRTVRALLVGVGVALNPKTPLIRDYRRLASAETPGAVATP